jgi:biopolymer transport protein ExbB
MLAIVLKGGIIVYILFLFSLVGMAIFIERLIFLRNSRNKSKDFLPAIRALFNSEGVKAAYRYCNLNPSIISNVFKGGLRNSSRSTSEIRAIIESVGELEIRKLEKNLVVLSSLGGVSPLVGFLGTVTGMIKAFMEIDHLGGNVNASVLAGGIWEALITTAVGLGVAIPLYLAYNFIVSRIEDHILEVEESSIELISILTKKDDHEII